ncbi:MAG: twin-arginine translocase subunit TatC [Bdellovibrionales bacterium]|nr:twin-arginine translocase subunit TatC [Bdellovibrionales bacterium]
MKQDLTQRSDQGQMSFWDHIRELRSCILKSLVSVVLGFFVAYGFSKELFRILRMPYDQVYQKVFEQTPYLINTSLLEGFIVYLKVGILGGFFLASPFVFYQVWKFISPALKNEEKKHVIPFVFLASIFFTAGALFGYFVVFPPSFEFFLNITLQENIQPTIRMDDYYRLASWMLLGFGASFEAPLITLYLVFFGILSPTSLLRAWRGVIVGILVASAVITPTPDVGTMMMMALPLFGLYGITIILAFAFFSKPKKKP